jgi:hypothetical protein
MSESTEDNRVAGGLNAFREPLLALYAELDAEVAALAPVCELSGRCCRFAEYDHTLFLSAPEAELLLTDAPPPVRPLDEGSSCPWQDERGRCQARAARPLGCRVFFCDPVYLPVAPGLSERYLERVKQLTDAHDFPWNYAPLHAHLKRAVAEGRFPPESTGEPSESRSESVAPILT